QEVGDAIIAYIERARPRVATARVFLTNAAPVQPLSRVAVTCVVRRALDRAGVDSPHRGAHVLRHSAATAMLGHGVSLAGVGAVGRTQGARGRRWTDLTLFARFLQAEDAGHEVPPNSLCAIRKRRPIPYIYRPDEIARILDAAGELRRQRPNPLRRQLYVTM